MSDQVKDLQTQLAKEKLTNLIVESGGDRSKATEYIEKSVAFVPGDSDVLMIHRNGDKRFMMAAIGELAAELRDHISTAEAAKDSGHGRDGYDPVAAGKAAAKEQKAITSDGLAFR